MNEGLYLHAYVRAPYRWNTVGFMEDLKRITLVEAKAYFETYYAPNNAVVVLSGDVEPDAALALVRRLFGGIPAHTPPPPVDAGEPVQDGERVVMVRKHAELPSVLLGYHAVNAMDPDRPALDVAGHLLAGGESSRLTLDLVRTHEVATSVAADLRWGIDPDLFLVYAQAKPGKTADELTTRIDEGIAALARGPVTDEELARAKRQLRMELVKGLKTVGGKANQLGYFEVVFGDYRKLFDLEAAWNAVTAADVQRVVSTYLILPKRTRVVLEPQGAGRGKVSPAPVARRWGRRGAPRRLRVLGSCAPARAKRPPAGRGRAQEPAESPSRRPPPPHMLAAFLAGALCVFTVAFPIAALAEDLQLPPVTRITLDNGLRLIVAETHEVPLVEFYVMVGAGAAQDPPGKEGLAALTADALTRGAGDLDAEAFARTVESLGGALTAEPGTDGTIVNGEFLAEDFGVGLDLLRRTLREPTLAADEIRRGREAQLAGLVASLEDPSTVAEKCFAGFLYGSYPYGRWLAGSKASVAGLSRGNVRDFYGHWYRPNNVILAVVGDIATADAVAHVREAFGSWEARPDAVPARAGPPEPLAARRVLLVDQPDASQAQIRIGAIAMARNDPELLPAQVANTVLGGGFSSKLIEELRVKRSLTYGASSAFVARLTGGDFRISTFSKSPTAVETLTLALDVASTFRREPVDAKALAKAKSYLVGQFPLRLETPDALAARLAEIEFFGLPKDDLETYVRRVAAVTPMDASARRRTPHADGGSGGDRRRWQGGGDPAGAGGGLRARARGHSRRV